MEYYLSDSYYQHLLRAHNIPAYNKRRYSFLEHRRFAVLIRNKSYEQVHHTHCSRLICSLFSAPLYEDGISNTTALLRI